MKSPSEPDDDADKKPSAEGTSNSDVTNQPNEKNNDNNKDDNNEQDVYVDDDNDDTAIVTQIYNEILSNNERQLEQRRHEDGTEGKGTDRNANKDIQYDPLTCRVVGLALGTTLATPYDHHWDLSPLVGRLSSLEYLRLTFCKSLPEEISKLGSLKKLTLIGCKRLDEFPSKMFPTNNNNSGLYQLEELRILGIGSMTPPYILSQIAHLQKLKVLQFSFHADTDEQEIQYLSQIIRTRNICQSLQELILNRCHISTDGFHFLLSQTIPSRFPHLRSLSLCKNQIKSFQHQEQQEQEHQEEDQQQRVNEKAADYNNAVAGFLQQELQANEEAARNNGNDVVFGEMSIYHGSPFARRSDDNIFQPSSPAISCKIPRLSLQSPTWEPTTSTSTSSTGLRSLTNNIDGSTASQYYELQELILSDNPIWSVADNEIVKKEQACLEEFLTNKAIRLGYLGYRFEKSRLWTPQIQHWLDVNKYGRYLLMNEVQGYGGNQMYSTTNKASGDEDNDNTTMIPSGLWANVFEHVNNVLSKQETIVYHDDNENIHLSAQTRTANVMYHFIRKNGPLVEGR